MAKPWSALTEVLIRPLQSDAAAGRSSLRSDAREAWLEAAGRLGLVRLGFEASSAPASDERWMLAYPCPRALVRWRAAAALGAYDMRADGEDIVTLEVPGGRLVAGAPRGRLPRRADLAEIARLASAIARREADARDLGRIRSRERRARSAAAAVHDLRNELTRALMWARRGLAAGVEDDADTVAADELVSALRGARALAGSALQGDVVGGDLQVIVLRDLLTREASAALAAARPAGRAASARTPTLRMRCGARRTALVEPRSFARAIRNLLTNAVEATARRGGEGVIEVEVRALGHPEPGSWPDLARAGFDLAVEVRDDGVGFAPDALRRYLEPAIDRRALDAGNSTGFGSSSIDLALRMSGVPVRVRSAPMRGTRVTLFLRSTTPERVLLEPDVRRACRTSTCSAAAPASAAERTAIVATEAAARLLAPPRSAAPIGPRN